MRRTKMFWNPAKPYNSLLPLTITARPVKSCRNCQRNQSLLSQQVVRSNIAVPDVLSITGFDDMPLSGTQMIVLTTIRHPVEAMALTAARRLCSIA